MDDKQFWLVWNPQSPSPPMHRHSTLDSATTEAERLARLHKGERFYVLEATHARVVDSMQRITLGEEVLPF